MQVQQAISAIMPMGIEEAYKRLLKTMKECNTKLKWATFKFEYTPEGQDETWLNQAEKTAAEAEHVFQHYSNLIAEKAR